MTEVLLKELSKSDIDWMIANGQRQEIAAGTVLVQENKPIDTLHILLDGSLIVTAFQVQNQTLNRAYTAMEGGEICGQEVARLLSGEVIGKIPSVTVLPNTATIKALERSLLMSIPQQQLLRKLERDVGFAARFYRAIAILLADRLQSTVNKLGHNKLVPNQYIKDILFVFGELHDSDIDWIINTGIKQEIPAGKVLINQGKPVDSLYILLDGTMTVSFFTDNSKPLARAFAVLEGEESLCQEIAKSSRGEIFGETPFIDARLPSTTIKAFKDSFVLSIPRQKLAVKLQQDIGFASRFYRVICTILSTRLQGILSRLGYGNHLYTKGRSLSQTVKYEDELDFRVLDQMAIAATRFNWMLKRLGVMAKDYSLK